MHLMGGDIGERRKVRDRGEIIESEQHAPFAIGLLFATYLAPSIAWHVNEVSGVTSPRSLK
jgi:hypothetical protein